MDEADRYLEVCRRAAIAGGEELQRWVGRFAVREKGPADLVTEADLAAQEVVRETVRAAYPDHDFLGEEGPAGSRRSEFRWIVDPLDGTINFVHGVPHYACSLALERGGEPLVGVVYEPNHKECYMAAAGRGATLDGRPIHVSEVQSLGRSLAAVGLPSNLKPDSPDLLVFNRAIYQRQSVRRTGSASLNLCYLAAGRFDVFWSFATKVWDIAAGVLMVREAGGIVTAVDGGPMHLDQAQFIASANPTLHEQLRRLVGETLNA